MIKINKTKIITMSLVVLIIFFSYPVSAEWSNNAFHVTHYVFADESDFTGDFVTANGIDGTYRRDFLYSFRGVSGQGTGLTRSNTYIRYGSGGGGWVNIDGGRTAPITGTDDWTNGRPDWIYNENDVVFGSGRGGSCQEVVPGVSVAADGGVLPCFSNIFIDGGGIGFRTVHDVGGAIQGYDIDVFVGFGEGITDGDYRVYVFDTEPPSEVTNLQSPSHNNAIGQWNDPQSQDNTVTITWADATDNIREGLSNDLANGLDGYSIVWDHSPNTLPDETKDIEEGVETATSDPLASGNDWYFHIRSVDKGIDVDGAGDIDDVPNWDDTAAHIGPFYIAENLTLEIISPTQSSPTSAGAYDNPSHIDVTVEVKEGTTPVTGLTNADFSFKIGGKTATASLTDTSIAGRYVFDVTPPTQVSPGKYDLEVTVTDKGHDFTDTEKEAVEYTSGNVDVMLIIDRSGSMRQEIGDAKQSAKMFVDLMNNGDKAGVVSFSSYASYNYHLTTLTDAVKTSMKSAINGIYASGATAMGRGLWYGLNDLTSYGDPTHPRAMVLLSDGYHNRGEHPNNVLPGIRNANIKVFTIGLGPYVDSNLLRSIAQNSGAGGGKYYHAASSSDLKEIYDLIVGMVIGQQTVSTTGGTILPQATVTQSVPITSMVTSATFSISWGGSDLDLVLYKPDGSKIDPGVAAVDPTIDYVEEATYEFYRVANPYVGDWTMEVIAVTVPATGESYTAKARVMSTLSMSLSTDKDQYNQGETVKTIVSLTEDGSPIAGATVTADIKMLDSSTETQVLYDDGGHGDGAANDGVYANYFANTLQTGNYIVDASATGATSTGEQFSREAQETFKVVTGPSLISLSPDTWSETLPVGGSAQKTFTVNDPAKVGELFPVDAEMYAEYNDTHYLVYNESSIGGEPDYIISSNPGPIPQVSKWVSLTATSLQTLTGDIIDSSNIVISPNVLEVMLGGSEDFNVTINVPSNVVAGTYTGKIVASAITGSDSIDIEVTVTNQPPIADANGLTISDEGSPITFNSSASYDPEGMPLTYRWDFDNDGTWDIGWSNNPTATNTWGDDFSGTAKVEVSDGTLTDTATASVTVNNVAPTVDAGADQTVLAGDTVSFSGSFSDPGWLDTHTIEWDFGDGNTATGTLTPTHVYGAGVYTVTLTVTDDDGGVGTDTMTVTVNPIPTTTTTTTTTTTVPTTTTTTTTTTTSTTTTLITREGGLGVAVLPKINPTTQPSTLNLTIKVVSTENFDDTIHVYLTTDGLPDAYKADLGWFDWTDKTVPVAAGGTEDIPLTVNIPSGTGSGYKMFRVMVESTTWTPTAYDTGVIYISGIIII